MRFYSDSGLQQMKAYVGRPLSTACPSHLWLDLTSDCNLHCVMCRPSPRPRGRVMDVALFRQIIDETCHAVLDYTLHNDGESLLLKDFPDRLAYVHDRKLPQAKLDLYTNGMLLCEETSRLLVDHQVTVTV